MEKLTGFLCVKINYFENISLSILKGGREIFCQESGFKEVWGPLLYRTH